MDPETRDKLEEELEYDRREREKRAEHHREIAVSV